MDMELERLLREARAEENDPGFAVRALAALQRAGAHQRAHEMSWAFTSAFPLSAEVQTEFDSIHRKALLAVTLEPDDQRHIGTIWVGKDDEFHEVRSLPVLPGEGLDVFVTQYGVYSTRRRHVPRSSTSRRTDVFDRFMLEMEDILSATASSPIPRQHDYIVAEPIPGIEEPLPLKVEQMLDYSPAVTFALIKPDFPPGQFHYGDVARYRLLRLDAADFPESHLMNTPTLPSSTYSFMKRYHGALVVCTLAARPNLDGFDCRFLRHREIPQQRQIEIEETLRRQWADKMTRLKVYAGHDDEVNPFMTRYGKNNQVLYSSSHKTLLTRVMSVKGISEHFYERLLSCIHLR